MSRQSTRPASRLADEGIGPDQGQRQRHGQRHGQCLRPGQGGGPGRGLACVAVVMAALWLGGCAGSGSGTASGSAGGAGGTGGARGADGGLPPMSPTGPGAPATEGAGAGAVLPPGVLTARTPGAPAKLAPSPSTACLEAIEGVAGQASGNRVLLGPAAFASSDELVLVRAPARGPAGAPLDGRLPTPAPVVLKLTTVQGICAVRQIAASGADAPGSTPSATTPPGAVATTLNVVDPVALPACGCQALAR